MRTGARLMGAVCWWMWSAAGLSRAGDHAGWVSTGVFFWGGRGWGDAVYQ